jgi:phosphopantothenoylcysteine decarboxylase/phosphopantothenate--cysteine ligase
LQPRWQSRPAASGPDRRPVPLCAKAEPKYTETANTPICELHGLSRILITSGPTRQYLDPVRFLSNASSGRMGRALAAAALEAGHEVVVVSGPVEVVYPDNAEVVEVVSTEDMLEAALRVFPGCDGLIAVAAPSDYRPVVVAPQKLAKRGLPMTLHLVETPDVVAAMAAVKKSQWMVAFALETQDPHFRAMQKLEKKQCDLIVLNDAAAVCSTDTRVEVIDRSGAVLLHGAGDKQTVARQVFALIQQRLIHP